ncbi:hypothetical protein F2Q69_00059055 [Brassica cretica]|uniref:Uncharacterized protein n=1 Tax=Brassica cretica TaxID=69181 RepID=A0A8S9RPY1_BRACR|nr:hypothetical protein F2Q69_00059055 [Brassica cretica]
MDSKIAEDICSFSCVMQESSFAHSPRSNEFFKEFIDVSHIEAVITRLWIRRVAPKTYVPSISAPTHPNHIHELLTSTPKKLNEEHPVSDRPPPLRDKKNIMWWYFVCWLMVPLMNYFIQNKYANNNFRTFQLKGRWIRGTLNVARIEKRFKANDDEEFVCSCEMETNERLCDYDEAMKISSTVEGHKQQHLRVSMERVTSMRTYSVRIKRKTRTWVLQLLHMTEKLLQEFSDKSRVKGLDVDALYIYTSKCTKQQNRDGGHIILMEINRMFFFMPH